MHILGGRKDDRHGGDACPHGAGQTGQLGEQHDERHAENLAELPARARMMQGERDGNIADAQRNAAAAVPAEEYGADEQRTEGDARQTEREIAAAHIVAIEQQIAEYERGLVEHARLMAAEQDQEGDRREIDEKAGKRTCEMCEMRCCRGEYEE